MDMVLKTLKKAEDAADEIERDAKEKAASVVKLAEVDSKKLEEEVESKAKQIGDKTFSAQLQSAEAEADRIRKEGKKKSDELEKVAGKNFDDCVKVVVDSTVQSMKKSELES